MTGAIYLMNSSHALSLSLSLCIVGHTCNIGHTLAYQISPCCWTSLCCRTSLTVLYDTNAHVSIIVSKSSKWLIVDYLEQYRTHIRTY